ncbi:hypothetical protein [Amycolatopsis sp. NBC_00438]|uniref:hypothetical protein n=1 Tax=Amycolatopsis sp. NBC_00438 TaxID=2903558 RepID=UPI002E1FD8E1
MTTTAVQPHETTPSGQFAAVSASAQQQSTSTFQIQLTYNGIDKGWLNIDKNHWAVMSDEPLTLQYYTDMSGTYYQIPGQNYYMSVSANDYVGFYGWNKATTFTLESDQQLKSNYNNQHLSFYSDANGFLYCYDSYNVFQPVALVGVGSD